MHDDLVEILKQASIASWSERAEMVAKLAERIEKYGDDIEADAYRAGRYDGYDAGHDSGSEEGWRQGYSDGYAAGMRGSYSDEQQLNAIEGGEQ
jgi:flagellar biosynthesis/type III secretory pathway protein FliH